jgi:long-chain acyl-CoA synthetase
LKSGTSFMQIEAYSAIRGYNLGDLIREHRRSRPHLVASVDGQERLSYRELDSRVNRVADALRKRGIVSGDRLMWMGQNSSRIIELLLACAKIGAVLCPANWRVSPAEFAGVVANFDPKMIIWQEFELGDLYHLNREEWQSHDRMWVQHDGEGDDSYEALVASGEDVDDESPIDPELPLLAIYTAGFDGQPKAAMLSHTAILLQALLSTRGWAIDETTSYLVSGPMFHVGVLMGGFATLVSGGRCVYVRRVEALELLDLVEDERVTHAFLPGPAVEKMMAADPEGKRDLSSLFPNRDLSEWTPPLAIPEHAPIRVHFGQYGQTELMGAVVLSWLGGTAAGRPAPFIRWRGRRDCGPRPHGHEWLSCGGRRKSGAYAHARLVSNVRSWPTQSRWIDRVCWSQDNDDKIRAREHLPGGGRGLYPSPCGCCGRLRNRGAGPQMGAERQGGRRAEGGSRDEPRTYH